MAQRHPRCDTNRLRLLLEDALPTPKEAEVVHHLDDCRQCQAELEKLAADRRLWDELPKLSALHAGQTPAALGRVPMLSEETAPPAGAAVDEHAGDARGGMPRLDFLDPFDDPEHLGRFDRFPVTAFLGRGGAGVVLKAFDAALNRPVAIKVLAPYFASSGAARQRFAREARAAAGLVHPNVVAIHGVDVWKGLPYLVMSYVAGCSLQERLDSHGPLDVKEILRIGMQTASGLAAAHAQGVVHRDVKPANILLENGIGRVWLTDFGLARTADDASLTQSGVIAGTPQYMAPEQAQGHAVDHRADLFSLGSTLYAMCTAHAPFRAESAMAVLRRVCDERARPVRTLNPDVPIWLAGIIDRLHAKAPADRIQTAAEVAELLEKCLAHVQEPGTHALPAELSPPPAPSKNKRRLWAAAALLMLGVGAPLGWSWLANRPNNDMLDREAPNASAPARKLDPNPAPIPGGDEKSLEARFMGIRSQAALLQADWTQPSVAGFGDPTAALLMDARRGLDILESELVTKSP